MMTFRCSLFWWYSSPRALLYRPVMWLMAHSEKLEDLLEGKSVVIVEDGELAWEKLQRSNMTEFEFLWSFA